jgi:hypothetical protein
LLKSFKALLGKDIYDFEFAVGIFLKLLVFIVENYILFFVASVEEDKVDVKKTFNNTFCNGPEGCNPTAPGYSYYFIGIS